MVEGSAEDRRFESMIETRKDPGNQPGEVALAAATICPHEVIQNPADQDVDQEIEGGAVVRLEAVVSGSDPRLPEPAEQVLDVSLGSQTRLS